MFNYGASRNKKGYYYLFQFLHLELWKKVQSEKHRVYWWYCRNCRLEQTFINQYYMELLCSEVWGWDYGKNQYHSEEGLWGRAQASLLSICVFNWSGATYWKDHLIFTALQWHFCHKSGDCCVWVSFWYICYFPLVYKFIFTPKSKILWLSLCKSDIW